MSNNDLKKLVINFGGPRSLQEIAPFLKALLCDPDVIRPKLPSFLQRLFFSYVARKRAGKVAADYQLIGGKSPIFEDTEVIAQAVGALSFHRYLPSTHAASLKAIQEACGKFIVFPMFPQFSYATTGSVARFFSKNLPQETVVRLRWIKSYAAHPAYIRCMQNTLKEFMSAQALNEEETAILFSAHGLPVEFTKNGDIYERECHFSYEAVKAAFPQAVSRLSFQSKFGRGEWLRPYTDEVCKDVLSWCKGRKNVVIVPLSFTSDHIETLFEIEHLYLPLIVKQNLRAFRCPALNRRADWIEAISEIMQTADTLSNQMLIYTQISPKIGF